MNVSGILRSNYSITNQMNSYKASIAKNNEKISTGKRVNSASDSPSDILRISRLNSQIRGSKVAQRNIQDGVSLLQTMEGAIDNVTNMGQRLKELSTQYQNDTLSAEDKSIIETEAKELTKSIQDTLNNTKFNGSEVFKKQNLSIQTGANSGENYNIKVPSFSKISSITTNTQVEVVSKNYGIDVSVPGMKNIKGNLTLDLRENTDTHKFHIMDGNQKHEGTLKFTNEKEGKFELQWKNGSNISNLTGTLNLNNISDSSNISGVNSYVMDGNSGNLVSSVVFNLKSEETKTVIYEESKDISLLNLSDENIKNVLKGDFVDKNILKPLSNAKTNIGIQERTLESRLKLQTQSEEINTNTLSKLENVDMAKEMMEKIKNQMLLDTNVSIFSENLDNQRGYILQLLR